MTAEAAERWLEENAVRCERYEMRLSPATCETYRREWPLRCQGCARAEGAPPEPVSPEAARMAGARRKMTRDIERAKAQKGARRRLESMGRTKDGAMVEERLCACGCGKKGKILARGLLAGCYTRIQREGGLARFATRHQATDHLSGPGKMVIVDDDFGREGASPGRLPEAGQASQPEPPSPAEVAAPKAKRSHTRGACRCCGHEGPLYGRGLIKACYRRHERAGTLAQFPPLIDSAQAKARRARATAATYEGSEFAVDLDAVLATVRAGLLAKNAAYGDSALNPVRVFSKADPLEQINVRLDDKLSRLMRGEDAGEDTEGDLLGYLVLKRVAMRRAVA